MVNYRLSSKYSLLLPRKEIIKNINRAQLSIDILCGELGLFADNPSDFMDAIKTFISKKNSKLQLAFYANNEESVKHSINSNTGFFRIVSEIPKEKLKSIKLYLIPFRSRRHYVIIDNHSTFIEGGHLPLQHRDLYCFVENIKVANEWTSKYLKMIQNPKVKEIFIEEIISDNLKDTD
ncbi:hypothetical protein ACFL5H_02775 [Candidatus Latescibacterota bacterium]